MVKPTEEVKGQEQRDRPTERVKSKTYSIYPGKEGHIGAGSGASLSLLLSITVNYHSSFGFTVRSTKERATSHLFTLGKSEISLSHSCFFRLDFL